MFKKNLLVISLMVSSALIQSDLLAYDPSNPPTAYVESEYDLAKEVMDNINNKTDLYRTAMHEYRQAKDNIDSGETTIYDSLLEDQPLDSERVQGSKNIEYRIVEAKVLDEKNKKSRHEVYPYLFQAVQTAASSTSGDLTVNGRSLLNDNVEMNHNLVVHNGLEAGDGILSATQNAVEVKLKPAVASAESKDIPSNTHGIVASNDGYAAVGYAGNQVGFNAEKAEILSASGQSRVTVAHDTVSVHATKETTLTGGKTSVRINDDGLTLNNARSHGVAPGVAETDAVNVGQLRSLRHHVNTVDKDLRAGIAMSMAAASVPQSYLPGKSLAALGAATYRGESGFAVGVSTITDNGKWVFKVNGTGDTRGNFGAGVGAGYLF